MNSSSLRSIGRLTSICVLFSLAVPVIAADERNPYLSPMTAQLGLQAPYPGNGAPMPSPIVEKGVPLSFSDNHSVFDVLEVVGRSAMYATLRYPMGLGGGFRTHLVKNGAHIFFGGRSYVVLLPAGDTGVQLSDKGKIIWEGDLSAPRTSTTTASPEAQYSPPLSAGVGVGLSPAPTMMAPVTGSTTLPNTQGSH